MSFYSAHFRSITTFSGYEKAIPVQLIEFIEEHYQASLNQELQALLLKVEEWSVHPCYHYPHLPEVLLHLQLLHSTLREHIKSEETGLFIPMKQGQKRGEQQALKELISLMEYEHNLVKEAFSRIRKVCQQYQPGLSDAVLPGLYERLQKCECLFLEQEFIESKWLFRSLLGTNT